MKFLFIKIKKSHVRKHLSISLYTFHTRDNGDPHSLLISSSPTSLPFQIPFDPSQSLHRFHSIIAGLFFFPLFLSLRIWFLWANSIPSLFQGLNRFGKSLSSMAASSEPKESPANNPGLQTDLDDATKGYFLQQTVSFWLSFRFCCEMSFLLC